MYRWWHKSRQLERIFLSWALKTGAASPKARVSFWLRKLKRNKVLAESAPKPDGLHPTQVSSSRQISILEKEELHPFPKIGEDGELLFFALSFIENNTLRKKTPTTNTATHTVAPSRKWPNFAEWVCLPVLYLLHYLCSLAGRKTLLHKGGKKRRR